MFARADRRALLEPFATWLQLVARRNGVDLPIIGWEGTIEAMERGERYETLMDLGFATIGANLVAEGRQEGRAEERTKALAQQRAWVLDLAEHRFGPEVARQLRHVLERVESYTGLNRASTLVMEAQSGSALIGAIERGP